MTKQSVKRNGNVVVLIACLIPVLAGFGAFAIDAGYIAYEQSRLQTGADAAALAAVEDLSESQAVLDGIAADYAAFNTRDDFNVTSTVEKGVWDQDAKTFAATSEGANAVRVTLTCPDISLFMGGLLGKSNADLTATAIAARASGGIGTRFIIDDEMIDKDVPSIESLANSLGRDPEELVTPRGFNDGKDYGDANWTWEDNFIDIPAGTTISLPTGQGTDYDNNDAGMFDIEHPEFPFTDDDSFQAFVMYSESGNDPSKWGTDDSSILNQLDPLVGASPVTDDSIYSSFVNPDFVHVSPITYSDVSTLNMQGGVPQLNAKGLRRGLLAFKIVAVGVDVDGPGGSVLPELVLEIVDPSTVNLSDLKPAGQASSSGGVRLVK